MSEYDAYNSFAQNKENNQRELVKKANDDFLAKGKLEKELRIKKIKKHFFLALFLILVVIVIFIFI